MEYAKNFSTLILYHAAGGQQIDTSPVPSENLIALRPSTAIANHQMSPSEHFREILVMKPVTIGGISQLEFVVIRTQL